MNDKKLETAARALLDDIKLYLADAQFFQREDLLHLPTFQDVATITRYQRVCQVVTHLIATGRLVAGGRTDLMLPARRREYENSPDPVVSYDASVRSLINELGGRIEVMTVVRRWTADSHLSLNGKRVVVRNVLRKLVREGTLRSVGYTYVK